jgi:hypothetical protein
VLVDPTTLDRLASRFPVAVLTGRPAAEAALALDRVGLDLPDELVEGAIERRAKVRAPQAWMERAAGPERLASRRRLSPGDAASEFLLNALRLRQGFEPWLFGERTGVPLAWLERPLAAAEADGLIEREPARIRTTARGYDFLNDLLARFDDEIERWGEGRETAAALRVVGERTDG